MAYVDLKTNREHDPVAQRSGNVDFNVDQGDLTPSAAPLSVVEAAKKIGCTPQALRARIKRGTLSTVEVKRKGKVVTAISEGVLRTEYPEAFEPSESQPVAQPEESDTSQIGEGKRSTVTTALSTSTEVAIDELQQLRAAAGRVPDLLQRAESAESALAEERAERRATLQALVISQEKVRALLEGPESVPVKTDRRTFYALAGVGFLGFIALGWAARSASDKAVSAQFRADSIASELGQKMGEVAAAQGQADTLRERLDTERDRAEALARQVESKEDELQRGERAARVAATAFAKALVGRE